MAGGLAGTIPGAAIGAVAGAVAGTIEPGLGNAVGAVAGAAAGAVISFGLGAAVAGGASLVGAANAQIGTLRSDSSGDREIEGSLRQTITETVKQKASAVRSLRSNIFVTDDQAEREKLQTRNITNYNHSHMLNLEYFEVLQHYRVELRLTEAEPLLFLPFRPLDFTFELIRNYWSTLRGGVIPRSLRQKFDRLIDGIESGSISSEQQKLKTVTIQLTLSPFILSSTLQVTLTGQPDVQQTKPIFLTGGLGGGVGSFGIPVVATAAFSFNNPRPNVENLTGLSVTGLTDSVGITVSIQTEDATGRAFRYHLGDSPVRPTDGIVNLPVNVGPGPDAGPNAIDEMERYFDERRYFFTRLLLLAIEKEQLIDLVEALQFQTTIEIPSPSFPIPGFPGLPFPGDFTLPGDTLRGILPFASTASSRVGTRVNPVHFASGQTHVATAAIEDLTIRVRDRMRDTLTAKIPAKNRATSAAAVSNVVEHALNVIRSELHRSPPVDAASIPNTAKLSVKTVKNALISTAGLTDRQATDVLKTTKLAEELGTSLTAAIKIPGILVVNVHLSEFIEPEPLAITGNTLVFRMKKVTDKEVLNNDLVKGKLKPLVDQPSSVQGFVTASKKEFTSHDVHLPTTGVFAEAILGRANASEKIDLTRFFNWQDSPIPHLAPRIADLQAGGRAQPPLETVPTVPASVVNIVNPPAFPDPTGFAASLAAVQNGNLFRDMSKTEALAGVLSNLSNLANQQGQLAGTLAGNAQKEALQAAVSFGNKVADLTGQALQGQQQPSPPQTSTEKGGALNVLDKVIEQLRSPGESETSPSSSDVADDPRARVVGVTPQVITAKAESPRIIQLDPDNQRLASVLASFPGLDPSLTEPQARNCCAIFPGGVLGFAKTKYLDLADVPGHKYGESGLFPGDTVGHVYTARGGYVDLGHVRDLADTTRFLASKAIALQKEGALLVLGQEGGARRLRIKAAGQHFPDAELAVMLALRAAYDFAIWHEIVTWFNNVRHWSFSPEDNFSNLLGCWIGAMACLRNGQRYNASADEVLTETLASLGAQDKATAVKGIAEINGLWFDPLDDLLNFVLTEAAGIPFETSSINRRLLRRHVVPLPSVTPWLVTDLNGKSFTIPDPVAGPGTDRTIDFDLGDPKPRPFVLLLPETTSKGIKLADFYEVDIHVDTDQVPARVLSGVRNGLRINTTSDLQSIVDIVRDEIVAEFPNGDRPIDP